MKHNITSQNTKKMLAQSLKSAMRKKPFSKITVSELIQDCGLNRKTFYYHFDDIYDHMKWMFEEEPIKVIQEFDIMVNYEEAIDFILNYVWENDYLLSCVYDSLGREQVKYFFIEDFLAVSKKLLESMEQKTDTSLSMEYKTFLCEFLAEGIGGILINAFLDKDKYAIENLKGYIIETVEKLLAGIFDLNEIPSV